MDYAKLEGLPAETLWSAARDLIGASNAHNAAWSGCNPVVYMTNALQSGEVSEHDLSAYIKTCEIVAIYDYGEGILRYTVALNDRRRDGGTWRYNAVGVSDAGLYEHCEIIRGRSLGKLIKWDALPERTRDALTGLGYFVPTN